VILQHGSVRCRTVFGKGFASGYLLRMAIAGWYTWKGDCVEGKVETRDIPALSRGIHSLGGTQFGRA